MQMERPNGKDPGPPRLVGTREDQAVFLLGWIWGRLETPALPLEVRVGQVLLAIERFYEENRHPEKERGR